jgi:hypothetical protein
VPPLGCHLSGATAFAYSRWPCGAVKTRPSRLRGRSRYDAAKARSTGKAVAPSQLWGGSHIQLSRKHLSEPQPSAARGRKKHAPPYIGYFRRIFANNSCLKNRPTKSPPRATPSQAGSYGRASVPRDNQKISRIYLRPDFRLLGFRGRSGFTFCVSFAFDLARMKMGGAQGRTAKSRTAKSWDRLSEDSSPIKRPAWPRTGRLQTSGQRHPAKLAREHPGLFLAL